MPAATQTRRIIIKVDTADSRAIQDVADKLGLLNRNTKSLAGNMSFLTNAFKGWLGFLGVRELTRMSDEMQNLSNRLKVVSQEGEDVQKVMVQIEQIASRTNQSIAGVGEVYTRMASALRAARANSGELLTLTESLINTFRVAGTTTTETVNTIIQLSQAFSSGELRGQELRSVMEQNAVLAGILRERFGKDIYKKAADGAIRVTDVLRALFENQQKINDQAKVLAPTFEQTVTKAMNSLTVAVGKVNEELKLSAKFAVVVGFAMEKLGTILVGVGAIVAVLGLQRLPILIAALAKLRVAAVAFVVSNPFIAALAATAVLLVTVTKNMDELIDKFRNLGGWVVYVGASIKQAALDLDIFLMRGRASQQTWDTWLKQQREITKMFEKADQLGTPTAVAEDVADPAAEAAKNMQSLLDKLAKMDTGSDKLEKIKDILGGLNRELQSGAITLEEYNQKIINFEIYKLNREFAEGKFNVFEFNKRITELRIEDLTRQLNAGVISLQQFNQWTSTYKIDELTARFQAGKIAAAEYHAELVKISDEFLPGSALVTGTNEYLKTVGTLSDQISKGITSTFGHLEDHLSEFIQKGTADFGKFAQAVLDDLNRIIVRSLIIRPLAQGILGFIGGGAGAGASAGGSYTDVSAIAAKGMAFNSGDIQKYAKGGVVGSPTLFNHSGGRGLMGEAGPEAILPLSRAGNGDLGVRAEITPVNITIVNQTGSSVETQESTGPNGERNIELFIVNKVRDGIATGKFDSAMRNSFGVKRSGS